MRLVSSSCTVSVRYGGKPVGRNGSASCVGQALKSASRDLWDLRLTHHARAAAVIEPTLHFHDFRRSAARNLRRAHKIGPEAGMKITGHETDAMSALLYR